MGQKIVEQFLRCDVTAEKFILSIYCKNQRLTENLKLVRTIVIIITNM